MLQIIAMNSIDSYNKNDFWSGKYANGKLKRGRRC